MTQADWLIAAGYVLAVIGAGLIWMPLAFLTAAGICLLLARGLVAKKAPQKAPPEE